jgi:hypothetical protein
MGRLGSEGGELVSSGGIDADGEPLSVEESLEYMQHRQESGESTRSADGVWRSAPETGASYDGPVITSKRRPGPRTEPGGPLASFARKAAEIERKRRAEHGDEFYGEPEKLPDWQSWAASAGLSEWEKRVAFYKLSHIGREQALQEQPDEESRKALQAAWKKFERTAMERLRQAAPEEDEEE